MRWILEKVFGRYCETCGHYRSDFCACSVRKREYRTQIVDDRPEWVKAESTGWPIKRNNRA